MASEPKVHDFTHGRSRLPVWVEASPVYEFLVGLFSYQSGLDDGEHAADRSTFLERIEHDASDDITASLADLAGCGGLWLTLLGVARSAPHPHTVAHFAAHLEAQDPVDLRLQMLHNSGVTPSRGHDEATIAAAAAGDTDAVATLLAKGHDEGFTRLLELEPEETRRRLVDLIRRIDAEVDLDLDEVMPVLERDAAATRALSRSTEPQELVERVTGGVTFEARPGLAGIVLIPSVVVRPWVVISEHEDLRIFCYPVSDEALSSDPATPPRHLIDVFKALGDERRLRILYLLSAESRSLGELAEKLDLAKSTTHHHLRVLRTAGLVRAIIGDDDKRYELRDAAISEAGDQLRTYLGLTEGRAEEKGT